MRLFMNYCFAFLAFGLVGESFASESVMYIDRPQFLSADMPQEIVCGDITRKGNIQHYAPCATDQQLWYQEQTLVGYSDLSETWVVNEMPWANIFTCRGRYCKDEDDQLVGINNHTGNEWIMGNILKGYYVVANGLNDVTLYRLNTGPYAEHFPDYLVYGEETTSITNTNHTTYDLWCNQQSDLCTFTDAEGVQYKLGREYLPDYIPLGPGGDDCMLEVCYNENGDVIGLNPDYHLFD